MAQAAIDMNQIGYYQNNGARKYSTFILDGLHYVEIYTKKNQSVIRLRKGGVSFTLDIETYSKLCELKESVLYVCSVLDNRNSVPVSENGFKNQ